MIKTLLSTAYLVAVAGSALAQPAADTPSSHSTNSEVRGAVQTAAAAPSSESSQTRSDASSPSTHDGPPEIKTLSGMSVLGNQEAPTSLVIVPWKSSEMAEGIGVSRALETAIRPVDKDIFARELRYYEIRAKSAD
jgi:hypothetical protein